MAKQQKVKYTVTATVVDTVPEGGKALKLKDVKALVNVAVVVDEATEMAGGVPQLTLGKVKLTPAE